MSNHSHQGKSPPAPDSRQPDSWHGWRIGAQAFFLFLFVGLTLSIWTGWGAALPHDLFLRMDPLLWLASSLTSRERALHAGFALALLLLTAGLGRVFCGWVCPLGTLMDSTRAGKRRKSAHEVSRLWSSLRYGVLSLVIGAALMGVNLAGWVDPLAIGTRALHLAPLAAEIWLPVGIGWAVLLGAIGLGLVIPRLWCRILCPLGAVLSLVARFAACQRRVANCCTACGACSTVCPMGELPKPGSTSACMVCRRCVEVCPQGAISFESRWRFGSPKWRGLRFVDRSRRTALFSLGGLVAGTTLSLVPGRSAEDDPLRPPGAPVELDFAARCIGCGACLSVCPTGGLRPMLRLNRLNSAFSPEFVPRIGPCLPACTSCGTVCPTGAIARLSTKQKESTPIGVAVIQESRCLPWANQERCVICIDACPPEFRAIELRRVGHGPFRPFVQESRCSGCGICEHRCPVDGAGGIRVVASVHHLKRVGS